MYKTTGEWNPSEVNPTQERNYHFFLLKNEKIYRKKCQKKKKFTRCITVRTACLEQIQTINYKDFLFFFLFFFKQEEKI